MPDLESNPPTRRKTAEGAFGRPMIIADTGGGRRWLGWVLYLALFALVVAAFMYAFVRLTDSFRVALVAVTFMVGYMLVAARLAERHAAEDAASHNGRGGLG